MGPGLQGAFDEYVRTHYFGFVGFLACCFLPSGQFDKPANILDDFSSPDIVLGMVNRTGYSRIVKRSFGEVSSKMGADGIYGVKISVNMGQQDPLSIYSNAPHCSLRDIVHLRAGYPLILVSSNLLCRTRRQASTLLLHRDSSARL